MVGAGDRGFLEDLGGGRAGGGFLRGRNWQSGQGLGHRPGEPHKAGDIDALDSQLADLAPYG